MRRSMDIPRPRATLTTTTSSTTTSTLATDVETTSHSTTTTTTTTRAKGSGRGVMNTHASSSKRFERRARGTTPEATLEATTSMTAREHGEGNKSDRREWWRALDVELCDAITLEPLRELAYAPFELDVGARGRAGADANARGKLFDGVVLAEYVTASKSFENPLTREPMDQGMCRALDAYLARWKLKKFSVEKTYNAAMKEKKEALANAERRSAEQARNMLREREELQATLASTMFSSLRERAANSAERQSGRGGGAGGQRRREEHQAAPGRAGDAVHRSTSISDALADLQADGRFALVDDDVAMLRDVSLIDGRGVDARGPSPHDAMGMGSWGGWSRPSHIESSGEAFPELPGASRSASSGNWVAPVPVRDTPTGEAFPSLATTTNGRPNPSWGALNKSGALEKKSAAERIQAIPVKTKATAANIFASKVSTMSNKGDVGPSSSQGSSQVSSQDPAIARKHKLADAFGVVNPDERPSMFAEASATAFTHEQLVLARKHPELVKRLESTLEEVVTGKTKRRISMEPMPREMRELCHVVAELYGITSASFGNEPSRHIDFFASPKNGALPSLRLSDAMRVDLNTTPTKGSLASMTRPEEAKEYFTGYTRHFSNGEYETLALRFTDIAVGVSGVKSALREFSNDYVMEEINDDHVVAHFCKLGPLLQASGKLGGGMRGKFRVKILEQKCTSKESVVEAVENASSAASSSTSARLFRASTTRAPASVPKDGEDAIKAAMEMFGL